MHSSVLLISLWNIFPCLPTFISPFGGVACPYTMTQSFQNTWSMGSPLVIPWAIHLFPALWIIHLPCVIPHMSITTLQWNQISVPCVVPSPTLLSKHCFKWTHWWQYARNTPRSWTYPTLKVPLLVMAYPAIHTWNTFCYITGSKWSLAIPILDTPISVDSCVTDEGGHFGNHNDYIAVLLKHLGAIELYHSNIGLEAPNS